MQIIHGIHEKDLIVRLKNGDQTAFELLFHFYYPGLVMYSTQFTTDRMEAEEIVQNFFVRFWQRHQQIVPSDSLKNYLFLSVKNGSLNYLKHKKIEEKYIRSMSELANNHLIYEPDVYVETELQEKIKNAIDLLPEKCREIFIMSRIRGLKNEEIASELNLSKRTVETQISKALKVMRVELKDYAGLLVLLGIWQ
ncbi:MAG TPA: RNA polymerase sigma-70 factor [Prolixibacteraceae bacterium]|nr:RNA polymerase sigma-70 factor [Prolixibacteraceae bacterium]